TAPRVGRRIRGNCSGQPWRAIGQKCIAARPHSKHQCAAAARDKSRENRVNGPYQEGKLSAETDSEAILKCLHAKEENPPRRGKMGINLGQAPDRLAACLAESISKPRPASPCR